MNSFREQNEAKKHKAAAKEFNEQIKELMNGQQTLCIGHNLCISTNRVSVQNKG